MQKTQFEPHIVCKPSQIKYPTKNTFPRARDKHASCVHEHFVYVIAGKDGNTPLKDFWRYHPGTLTWELVSCRGDTPAHLEGHSLVSYKKLLLLFGGEFGDALTASSLWVINPDLGYVRSVIPDPGTERPCVRRHHSAVVYNGAMYVYGGYVDVKGSSSELWSFQIEDEEWELVSTRQPLSDTPGARYGHSAIVHNHHMWLYGGMADLVPKQDLWAFSFGAQRWERIKNKYGPPQLTGHSAAVVGSCMILFGGTTNREAVNQLWCFCFRSLKWTQIFIQDHDLSPLSFHTAVMISPSAQDSTVKASSMPYLQKRISQLNINRNRPRPRSSPAQRSQSIDNSNESVSQTRTPFERSISSQVFGVNGVDPSDPVLPKWNSLQKQHQPQVLDLRNEGSSESLKLYPAPAENAMDISPLIPERTDFNFNTVEMLNKNAVSNGIDNPGISQSTEELINDSRRKQYEINEPNCDTNRNNHAIPCHMVSINSDYVVDESLVSESQRQSAKKCRLDPELVLEDMEYSDSLIHNIPISYPKSNSMGYKRFASTESLPDSDGIETIELNDVPARNRSMSEHIAHSDYHSSKNIDTWSRDLETQHGSVSESGAHTLWDRIQNERISRVTNNQSSVYTPQSIETSLHSGPPIEEMNRRNRLYSKKDQRLRKTSNSEPAYMMILGGKDKQKANFSIKPITLWKFVFHST